MYAATVRPLVTIVKEIAGERAEVKGLLPPGASPHTYDPRPSEVRDAEAAAVLFYGSPLLDQWAARIPARHVVQVFEFIPETMRLSAPAGHSHETKGSDAEHGMEAHEWDPHFWTDPLTVKAILPAIAGAMAEADPEGRITYEANAAKFGAELDALDSKLASMLAPVKGKSVFLVHPSFQYLFHRYGIVLAGVIEASPGREPTPKDIQALAEKFIASGAKAVFTEPQVSPRSAAVLAEAVHAPVYELDPMGGAEGRDTYADLIFYNASVLLKALQ